jgi:hypothetical protein
VAFGIILRDKTEHGDVSAPKAYVRPVISYVEGNDHLARIAGTAVALKAAEKASPTPRLFVVVDADGAPVRTTPRTCMSMN